MVEFGKADVFAACEGLPFSGRGLFAKGVTIMAGKDEERFFDSATALGQTPSTMRRPFQGECTGENIGAGGEC